RVVARRHRGMVALARRQESLDARVVEYLPDRADPANRLHFERRAFVNATALPEVVATDPGRYRLLQNRIRDHAREFGQRERPTGLGDLFGQAALAHPLPVAAADPPTLRAAARDWYEREYRPVVEVLVAERIVD